ncbi:MAG: carboxypeptidase-like regulatory domain-containing protein [Pseudomonadota bacterium]
MKGLGSGTLMLIVSGCAMDAAVPMAPREDSSRGDRCVNASVLEDHSGNLVQFVDCGTDGRLCGPSPAAPSVGACVGSGDECGSIDETGACSGTVLAICLEETILAVVDCAALGGVCVYDEGSAAYRCATTCSLAQISAEGVCIDSITLARCELSAGVYRIVQQQCPDGSTCRILPETGAAACLASEPCDNVGPQGLCRGNQLVRCRSMIAVTTDCAVEEKVCGYGGDRNGYVCLEPADSGRFQIHGTVFYEDRPPEKEGLGPTELALVRGASVAIVAESGEVLAVAVTADDGTYSLRFDAPDGTLVSVLAATTSTVSVRPVRVLRPDGLVHGIVSSSFVAGDASAKDLIATESSGTAPAFNIFAVLIGGLDYLRSTLDFRAIAPLYAVWAPGSSQGTYYQEDGDRRGIFLLGELADNDGHDDSVIAHELGHYFEYTYGETDSPGGEHDGSPTTPTLAWSEGFATFFSCAILDSPWYYDSNAAGGWYLDLESTVTAADPNSFAEQYVSEDMVSEILWDVSDAPANDGVDDDDLMTAGIASVLQVEVTYFHVEQLLDRGVDGEDLVDWLDGWFVQNGLESCSALREIVTEQRLFPYDYDGPAGSCPP